MTTALHFAQGADRDAYVVSMRRAGHTLQAIADTLGVSRERVRQLAKRNGSVRVSLAAHNLDPIALLRFARSRECRSCMDCARHFGVDATAVHRAFRALCVLPALTRLYRWRRMAAQRALYIAQLHAFVAEHGRAPTTREMNARGSTRGLPFASELQRTFGTFVAGFAAAGLGSRGLGSRAHLGPRIRKTHCRRGHELTPPNLYTGTKPDGTQWRQCKACHRAQKRAADVRKRERAA
jgi:hypothetical protein